MKIDRLIGIITILLQQDKVTAPELAQRFEVSRRTINRDIEDICKAGIPLVTVQGYGGGISVAEGYKIDKTIFTQEELQRIFTGLQGIDSVSRQPYRARLTDKLSGKADRVVAEDIIINLASHYQESLIPKIEAIREGILRRHILSFRYYYQKGESLRRIEPYHLVFQWSSWYVFGYCLSRDAYRLFKLNRLWDLKITEERFSARVIPEAELEFEDYFASKQIHLKALFDERAKYRLIEEYGVDCYSEPEDGGLLLERDFASYDNMREWVFSFGDRVHVLEPQELREERRKQAENIINMDTVKAT